MNKEEIMDAYILLVSGAAQMKNAKEMWWKDKDGKDITIEFPDLTFDYTIIRQEFKETKEMLEIETKYKNNKEKYHKRIWYKNRLKSFEDEYKNNELNGKVVRWYDNGVKRSEGEWKNGLMDGYLLVYNTAGGLKIKEEYKKGERIK